MNDDYNANPIKIDNAEPVAVSDAVNLNESVAEKTATEAVAAGEEKASGKLNEDLEDLSEEELIYLFVEQLMIDKGMADLDEALKNEVRDDLTKSLLFQVNRAILMALPDEDYKILGDQLDSGEATMETVQEAVKAAGVDVDKVVRETMEKFREIYLDDSGTVEE